MYSPKKQDQSIIKVTVQILPLYYDQHHIDSIGCPSLPVFLSYVVDLVKRQIQRK